MLWEREHAAAVWETTQSSLMCQRESGKHKQHTCKLLFPCWFWWSAFSVSMYTAPSTHTNTHKHACLHQVIIDIMQFHQPPPTLLVSSIAIRHSPPAPCILALVSFPSPPVCRPVIPSVPRTLRAWGRPGSRTGVGGRGGQEDLDWKSGPGNELSSGCKDKKKKEKKRNGVGPWAEQGKTLWPWKQGNSRLDFLQGTWYLSLGRSQTADKELSP